MLPRLLTAISLAAASATAFAAPPRYTIEWLADLPSGTVHSQGMAINNSGLVGGQSAGADGHVATQWAAPARDAVSLGDLPGGVVSSMVYGVNDAGTSTGTANNGNLRAFRRLAGGAMVELGDLPGGSNASGGYAINDADVVVGYSYNATSGSRPVAVLWAPGSQPLVLGDLPGGQYHSEGRAINTHGMVAGTSFSTNGRSAFVWTAASGMQELPDLPGASWSSDAYGINDAGWIVGSGYAASGSGGGTMHATLWRNGEAFDLGSGTTQSYAYDINNRNQIVGVSANAASIWDGSQAFDLNQLVDGLAGSGVFLQAAYAINDHGQITGWGSVGGNRMGFVLTEVSAVPEPGSWALWLAGLAVTGRLARRRR